MTTTTNNHLTLIDQVGGIEKAKAIVEGATFGTHYRVDTGRIIYCPNENHFFFADQIKLGVEFIRIDDLRTAIAQHESNNHQETSRCNNSGNCEKQFNSSEVIKQLESDHVTDITNHISPNTKVINHG